MKKTTYWILEDQLSLEHPALRENPKRVRLLFIESRARLGRLRYHKKRLVLFLSAMRHFAAERAAEGWEVDYYPLGDVENAREAFQRHGKACAPEAWAVVEPSNYGDWAALPKISQQPGWSFRVLPNSFFLLAREEFVRWAQGKKRLLMEAHYRRMRERFGLLMEKGGEPVGGKWNFDAENRQGFVEWKKAGSPRPVAEPGCEPDAVTREVQKDLERFFPEHPGAVEGFDQPVTREQALARLEFFLRHRLGSFGDYQDLMVSEAPQLFHSIISPQLNLGLLSPLECAVAAEKAWQAGVAPLAAVEGFIRQIIGWREFVYGVYWLKMPSYAGVNELGAERPLPDFFYTGETELNCLRRCLGQVVETGYNHHIQRLMILGNFCLLAGIRPQEALRWFNEMYLDAHDWVMAANVLGMALHADGGFMATKPYAGGAAYISKMSNYCAGCRYDPKKKEGPAACPFNLLYWNFYEQHAERFERNPRTAMMVRSWLKRAPQARAVIVREAEEFLDSLAPTS
jgi:deoxyribodipyrimidine photolyase-related protein